MYSFDAAVQQLSTADGTGDSFYRPFLSLLPVTGASIATVGEFLGSETIAASDPLAARLDELQFDLGEGPCWQAMTSGQPVLTSDLRVDPAPLWPAFVQAVIETEVVAMFVFPLHVGPLRFGAIDLYSSRPHGLTEQQQDQAQALAGIVGHHVLTRALERAGENQFEASTPYSRRVVHQATGMVLAQLNISAAEAHLLLQGHAFGSGRTMTDVSEDILRRRLAFIDEGNGIEVRE